MDAKVTGLIRAWVVLYKYMKEIYERNICQPSGPHLGKCLLVITYWVAKNM